MIAYKKIFLVVFLVAAFIFSGCNSQAATMGEVRNAGLKIHMLDIGQGDAILIQTNEQNILIDTGRVDTQAQFVEELERFSVTKIDKLILSHPHADHIGGAKLLISPNENELAEYPYLTKISVGEVYDNAVVYTSKAYKNYIKETKKKNIPYQHLKVGDTLDFGGGVEFNVLFPSVDFVTTANDKQFDEEDRAYRINNGSIVGKLTYKNFSMMFTGDCEKESEAKILANNRAEDLRCDVLKSGHHGLATSSSVDFVRAINPSVVLISAGHKDWNEIAKGSPSRATLKNYLAQGVQAENIFATRFNGIITVVSDGKNFSIQPQDNVNWVNDWIIKKKSNKKK